MSRPQPEVAAAEFPDLPLGDTAGGQSIRLGGFSGLWFDGIRDGKWQLVTHTDRGPNPDPSDLDDDGRPERAFALPDYQPRIVHFTYDPASNAIVVVEQVPLVDASGKPLRGLPNLTTDEIPIDLTGRPLATDPDGLDLECLVRTPDGDFWMGDEYRPSLVCFDRTGRLRERIVPHGANVAGLSSAAEHLPASLRGRTLNRGFEGLALDDGTLYAFLQSPLDGSGELAAHVVAFDPFEKRVNGEYRYPLDDRSAMIGDAAALGGLRFVVIEQNAKAGAAVGMRKLYRYDAVTSEKRLIADLMELGFEDIEKVEGIAIIDDRTIALVNDNDFGVSNEFDPTTGRFASLGGQRSQLFALRFAFDLGA